MRRLFPFVLAVALCAGCDPGASKPARQDGGTCAELLAQIQAAVAANTSCSGDGECAVLSTGGDPPVSATGCVAYVNTQGLDTALPLVAQWKNRQCGAQPCTGSGAQPACNAGTCGAASSP